MKICIKKWGNDLAVKIPVRVLRASRLRPHEPVEVRADAGRIVIEPVRGKRYDLDKLVRRITSKNRHAVINTGGAVGNEAW